MKFSLFHFGGVSWHTEVNRTLTDTSSKWYSNQHHSDIDKQNKFNFHILESVVYIVLKRVVYNKVLKINMAVTIYFSVEFCCI